MGHLRQSAWPRLARLGVVQHTQMRTALSTVGTSGSGLPYGHMRNGSSKARANALERGSRSLRLQRVVQDRPESRPKAWS
jgi:hypothetical protein